MPDPQPSVGRIVHYVSRGSADGVYPRTCRAAIITAVDDYQEPKGEALHVGHISLCVLNPEGLFFKQAVQDERAKVGGTWHWPERV